MDDRPTPSDGASDVQRARLALSLLDLTDLNDDCDDAAIDRLTARAAGDHGRVAAVCVWPRFVARSSAALRGTGVKVATVVNFPAGGDDAEGTATESSTALADGADEIDVVLPYRAFVAGDLAAAGGVLDAVRSTITPGARMKVILETGALPDLATVTAASRFAIEHGADFIKTSTGKIAVSATLDAARAMLEVLREHREAGGEPVGIKPSGGIRTFADATAYLDLADEIMGSGWATPATFRFGASGLLDALIAIIDGAATGSAAARPGSY